GSVYMLEGAGGNIGVSVGDDGIVLVDDEFAPLAPKIREALLGITDRPIKVVLNTHWHGDHTGGNAIFGADAPIVAHENVRKRLIAGAPARTVGGKSMDAIPPAPKGALPILTFDDQVMVHLNGEDIRAIHFPSGHTDGDVVIWFTQSNVVHMGDDFVTYGFPFVDVASGGSVKGLIAAIDKVIPQLPAEVKIIPGHGKISTLDDMKKLSATLKDCVKLVQAEAQKGKTLEQVQQAKPLAKYDDLGKGFIKPDAFVETIFKELTAPPPPH
ncbi:MAG TPA: MBL fold metallo-hydrolase, partial [Polyangiaceae bacterium]